MKNLIFIVVLLVSIGIVSCESERRSSTLGILGSTDEAFYEDATADLQEAQGVEEIEEQDSRKIIKEGDISFQTAQPESFILALKEKIKTYKGYISNETTHKYYDRNEYNITIRVTAQNFDTLVNWISNRVGKLDSKNIRVMDVTETFIDLETRIKTKKELEERYKELLKQAKTVKEVLEIEQQIGYLRAEIESFEGRFKYLSDRISYSTLTLVFYEKIENQSGRDYSFGKEIVNAFKSGWEFLLALLIGIVNIWPVLIIIGIPVFFVYKKRKRNKK